MRTMGCTSLVLLAFLASAAAVEECSAPGSDASSMLQHAGSQEADVQLLKREMFRQELMRDGLVQMLSMGLSGLISEGMLEADAIAFVRSLAVEFKFDDWKDEDLGSESSAQALFQEQATIFHEMLCRIREAGCEKTWGAMLQEALASFSSITAGSLKKLAQRQGEAEEAHTLVAHGQGQVDAKMFGLAMNFVYQSMKYSVMNGEDQDVVKHTMADAMAKLAEMDANKLLAYRKHSKVELAMAFIVSNLNSGCLVTTDSCSDQLARLITEYMGLSSGTAAGALVHAGVRPTVRVLINLLGLPEFPEETAGERRAAIKATLKQRKFGSTEAAVGQHRSEAAV